MTVEAYENTIVRIAFKCGLPPNFDLYRSLHKKKVKIMEKSFFGAYKYVDIEEFMAM